jgi:GNAT superfamily N-acetyltransferase
MIREATHDDVDSIVELGVSMHRESNFAPIQYCPENTAQSIHGLIESDRGFVAVSVHDGSVSGFIIAVAFPAWFGNGRDLIASDMVLYVMPERRRGTSAVFLASAFKDWALARGVRQVRAGTAAGPAGQAANAIYDHLGFKQAGQCFVLDAPRSDHHAIQTFDHHLAVQ